MKHKDKLKIARQMAPGKKPRGFSIFQSKQWEARKKGIASVVAKKEKIAHERSVERKKKLKILDDKGKEHRVGEIFESETVTIEV